MLYVCIPTYNEAVTVGVLLWRLRTTLRERAGHLDYEIVVYDDASTDATAEVLAPYPRVVPLTVLRGNGHVGQSAAVSALIAHVVARSRAPEADAVAFVQADYTDAPELLGEMLPLFDAGADVVLTRRIAALGQPDAERRLRRTAPVLLAPLIRGAIAQGAARDPSALLSFLRLFRVAVLRDALQATAGAPLVGAAGWAGTAELVVRTAPFAPRIERVEAPARFHVRTRPSRIDWTRELRAVAALLWRNRGVARTRRASTLADGQTTTRHAVRHADAATRDLSKAVPPADAPATVAPTVVRSVAAAPGLEVSGKAADAPRAAAGHVDAEAARSSVDDRGASDAAPRPARRRRRGRGRGAGSGAPEAGAPEAGAPEAGAPEPVAPAPDAPISATRERTPEPVGAPDAASDPIVDPGSAHDTPDGQDTGASPAPRRRRRRGGARRRARSPESDSGVPPENPDAGAATRQDAPSDQSSP